MDGGASIEMLVVTGTGLHLYIETSIIDNSIIKRNIFIFGGCSTIFAQNMQVVVGS